MQVAIYTRKGTLGKRFMSVLKILIEGRKSERRGRSRIDTFYIQRRRPLVLMHNNQQRYPGTRVTVLPAGTSEFARVLGAVSLEPALPEPVLMAHITDDDPDDSLMEKFVGMLARHARSLGVASIYILLDERKRKPLDPKSRAARAKTPSLSRK